MFVRQQSGLSLRLVSPVDRFVGSGLMKQTPAVEVARLESDSVLCMQKQDGEISAQEGVQSRENTLPQVTSCVVVPLEWHASLLLSSGRGLRASYGRRAIGTRLNCKTFTRGLRRFNKSCCLYGWLGRGDRGNPNLLRWRRDWVDRLLLCLDRRHASRASRGNVRLSDLHLDILRCVSCFIAYS